MKITLKPINANVLIKRLPVEETKSAGGIILDGDLTLQKKESVQSIGTILDCGPFCFLEEQAEGFPPSFKKGDTVYFKEVAGRNVKHWIEGEDPPTFPNCVLLNVKDVLCVAEVS